MENSPTITNVLRSWSDGDEEALNDLMALVYTELKDLSRRAMAGERASHTLQPTALVNEVYLRLARLKRVSWENRSSFFGFAARIMRRVLVEHARAIRTVKRGGGAERVNIDLDHLPDGTPGSTIDILILDELLKKLEEQDPQLVQIIDLRFFVGLTEREIAKVLGKSRSTIRREWSLAKRLLVKFLDSTPRNEGDS